MSKSRLDKIASYEEQIAELNNRKKQEMQKHRTEERKARTRRLIERGAILESFIPNADSLNNEQVKTLLQEAFDTAPPPAKTKTSAQSGVPAPSGGDDCMTGTG